jgi:UDP:flavonoid glycosyltransferase YjiC (YdhE family)
MTAPRNILIASISAAGHVNPATSIARTLVERGHTVHWYTGSAFRSTVEGTGAHYEPVVDALDIDANALDTAFPERAGRQGLAGLKFDLKHLFLDNVPGQVRDLQRILREFPADVLLVDTAFMAASMLHELGGPRYASYGVSILPIPSADVPPIGSGRQPSTTSLGRWRDRLLSGLAPKIMFRDVQRHHQMVRGQLGLAPTPATVFDTFISPYLYMQASTSSFEFPRRDLPSQVHFIGPLLPEQPTEFHPPAWWHRLDGRRPVVLVNQGTIAVDLDDLVGPTLTALGGDDVEIIATGGGGRDGLSMAIPANAHVEPYVPFGPLLPHVDVMLTNGGYGGVQFALANGVPMIVAGTTEDKPDVAARVAWSGAGINLGVKRPTPGQIRDAVWSVLTDERYAAHARRIQRDASQLCAPRLAADLVEALVATGRPVHRERFRSALAASATS